MIMECLVGIPANNLKKNKEVVVDIGKSKYDDKDVNVVWKMELDWDRRIKVWDNEIDIGGEKIVKRLDSYLVTKEELKEVMEKVGLEAYHLLLLIKL